MESCSVRPFTQFSRLKRRNGDSITAILRDEQVQYRKGNGSLNGKKHRAEQGFVAAIAKSRF